MKHVVLLICLAATVAAVAADRPDPAAVQLLKKSTDRFMADLVGDKPKEAFDRLFVEWWVIPDAADSASVAMQAQVLAQGSWRARFTKMYGKPMAEAIEFLGSLRTGKDELHLVYLEHYERDAAPWLFSFYRGRAGWKLANVYRNPNEEGFLADDLRRLGVSDTGRK